MTADELKRKIALAAGIACHLQDRNIDTRARAFVAALSGMVQLQDKELADAIFSVLQPLPGGPHE